MSSKIFISHAAADEKLATAHVDCIYSCMVPDDDEVRCTSVPGHKLPIGGDAATILRKKFFTFISNYNYRCGLKKNTSY